MTQQKPIRLHAETLSEKECQKIIEDFKDDTDTNIKTITSISDEDKLIEAITERDVSSESEIELGPQFADGLDPEIILIFLESTIILIETTKIGIIAKNELSNRWRNQGEETEEVDVDQVVEDIQKLADSS